MSTLAAPPSPAGAQAPKNSGAAYSISAHGDEIRIKGCERCRWCCTTETNAYPLALTDDEALGDERFFALGAGACSHLDPGRGCSLGGERYLVCKLYPFLVLDGQVVADMLCPAVRKASPAELKQAAKVIAAMPELADPEYRSRVERTTLDLRGDFIPTGVRLPEKTD